MSSNHDDEIMLPPTTEKCFSGDLLMEHHLSMTFRALLYLCVRTSGARSMPLSGLFTFI
ncbi:hypothetical protein M407DRAFT_242242 [Tulasnella calospora MUT 4182]|uniref:Uncharacterized protein n=1 Tax=Tulasnella calospora MUT 4182 TaxID=1051891 RepID=A0A0C3QRG2_9AGAM|nr:hypothetical protein M407DRAFT_242242 [Tulasnella calospora MUT 4182]